MIKIEERITGTFLLTLKGHVDFGVSPQVRKVIDQLCKRKTNRIIVDFTAVDSIDSSGIATLLERQQRSKERKIRFILAGIPPRVEAAFDIAKLRNMFEVVPRVEAAFEEEDDHKAH